MHANTLTRRANRERILSVATTNIAGHGFAHATRRHIMAGADLAPGSLQAHFPGTTRLLAAICERHARALLEATGCVDPNDPAPPREALVATCARVLACIDAHGHAHTVLMRDSPCLPAPARAEIDYLDQVAAHQVDLAWIAIRPDLATPDRIAGLTRPLRTLLLRWPDWREPGPAGHPDAAAARCVAMVEATIDRALPPSAQANPHAHWLRDHADRRAAAAEPPRTGPDARDTDPYDTPFCPEPRDRACPDPQDAPAHPGQTLRESLARHGLTPGAAAARLGVTRQRLHDIVHGTRAITPDTALRLEALLDERAETWMARQARHDIDALRRAAPP